MQRIERLYELHIVEQGREPALLVLLAFLATFIIVRMIVHWIRSGRARIGNLEVGELHVHHLVWGILLLLVTGFITIALLPSEGWARSALAVAYGVGAALTLDEFALWLHLQDVYWEKEGRKSIDAVIIAASLIGMFILGSEFLVAVLRKWIALEDGIARVWLLEADDSDEVFAISTALTILAVAGLWLVFDKAGLRGWLALIPVVNFYLLIRIAGKPSWWIAMTHVPVLGLAVHIAVMLAVARRFGHGRGFGLGLVLLPALFLLLLGMGRDRYDSPSASAPSAVAGR